MGRDPHKVIIVGGGVAGLSAAHELAERGFAVEVYERRRYYGGKAASVTTGVDNPSRTAPRGLPGEHGFRFFPGWYKHLPDTMKRIPFEDRFVIDNLVPADVNLLVDYDRDPVKALVRFPTNLAELKTAASFPSEILRLGLTVDDIQFFLGKLWQFLTASEERRLQEYEHMTWWEFMDAPNRSRAFRDYLVTAATRNTVAARPTEASAYTIAKVTLQTLFDTLTPQTLFDRVLNGPTNEVWIDPWIDYLTGLGVKFVTDCELDGIDFDGRQIRQCRFVRKHARRLAKARWQAAVFLADWVKADPPPENLREARKAWDDALAAATELLAEAYLLELAEKDQAVPADKYAEHIPLEVGARLSLGAAGASPAAKDRCEAYARQLEAEYQAASIEVIPAGALHDYYVFALPVEQMAYYVHRSENLRRLDPSLTAILPLSEHVDWMAGIQFYLTSVVNITRGHIDLLDSEWSLTAISQAQFWKDIDLKTRGEGDLRGKVRSILSVDISAWDRKGRFRNKEAYNCTPQEIAEEVWEQLKRSLNRPGKAPVLADRMLLRHEQTSQPGITAERGVPRESYYLDDSIVDRFDRKKQAVYDKALSVQFDADTLIRRHKRRGDHTEVSFQSGGELLLNAEPLLVNRAGSLALRPAASTQVSNMFLAADYVRTHTNLATMEGANEAARAAVNQILLASGSHERPCEIWPMLEPLELFRKVDEVLFRKGQKFEDTYADIPIRLVAGAANTTARMAVSALGKFVDLVKRK